MEEHSQREGQPASALLHRACMHSAAPTCVAGCTKTAQLSVPQQRSLAKSWAASMKRAGSPPQSRHTSCGASSGVFVCGDVMIRGNASGCTARGMLTWMTPHQFSSCVLACGMGQGGTMF